jgi:crotonobetainyl-CoA:carnitine CoA-transferase CaiB-like acyl-CoA transferase
MIAPLSGTRVVEISTMITAPLAGMMLADLGAEVIKVERREGDPFRSFAGTLYSPHFAAFNRNKKSVVLDLQDADGREALLKLVDDSDVVLDNFRPGVLERLKLATADLHARNPRIVHCSITGFGEDGPYSDRPAYDTVGQALSGIAGLQIDPTNPRFSGTTISDNVTGMYAAYAILAALVERQNTGRGRKVEVNMLEASVAFMPDAFMNLEMLGLRNDPFTRVAFSQSYVVGCQDGTLLALHLSSQDKFWEGLLTALADEGLGTDPRFEKRQSRIKNYLALSDELQRRFAAKPRAAWMTALAEHDVPFAPVYRTDEVIDDAQVKALGTFRRMTLPTGVTARTVQAPVLFDGARLAAWSAAPMLGEHTDEYVAAVRRIEFRDKLSVSPRHPEVRGAWYSLSPSNVVRTRRASKDGAGTALAVALRGAAQERRAPQGDG